MGFAHTVIQLSTRGTVDSSRWCVLLADKLGQLGYARWIRLNASKPESVLDVQYCIGVFIEDTRGIDWCAACA